MSVGAVREPRVPFPYSPLEGRPAAPASGATSPPLSSADASSGGEPSPFARVLHGIGRAVGQGEAAMRDALAATRAGRDLGPAELIALQAGVYRYAEAVDLAAKLVDRATAGIKTVVQAQ